MCTGRNLWVCQELKSHRCVDLYTHLASVNGMRCRVLNDAPTDRIFASAAAVDRFGFSNGSRVSSRVEGITTFKTN